MAGEFGNPEIVQEEVDILLIGGGMACCGAAYEVMQWADAAKKEAGVDLKIRLVDKAAMDRSGAVAQGLSAINTYIGTEQDPADYARMVSNDLMGITRDDLAYDVGRHVDDSVHLFEEWGLPIWKTDESGERHDGSKGLPALKDGGKPVRSGKWQIMINGESYKWIVAEAAKKALGADRIQERIFIVKLVNDKNDKNRVAGAVGFSTRDHKVMIYKAKAILLAAGGCVNIFRPRSVGEGTGRAWYPVWNAGSTYAMAAEAGAELTMMENRFVPARFKDGYGPVGAWFLLFKAQATNAYGEVYMVKNKELLNDYPPYGQAAVPASCLRNHLMLKEMKEGRGPICRRPDRGGRRDRRGPGRGANTASPCPATRGPGPQPSTLPRQVAIGVDEDAPDLGSQGLEDPGHQGLPVEKEQSLVLPSHASRPATGEDDACDVFAGRDRDCGRGVGCHEPGVAGLLPGSQC